jgi:hypothetical protein
MHYQLMHPVEPRCGRTLEPVLFVYPPIGGEEGSTPPHCDSRDSDVSSGVRTGSTTRSVSRLLNSDLPHFRCRVNPATAHRRPLGCPLLTCARVECVRHTR